MSIQTKLFIAGLVVIVVTCLAAAVSWSAKDRAQVAVTVLGKVAVPSLLRRTEAETHFQDAQLAIMRIALWNVMNGAEEEKAAFVAEFETSLAALDEAHSAGFLPSKPFLEYRARIVNAMTLVQRNPRIGFAAMRGVRTAYLDLAHEISRIQQAETAAVNASLTRAMQASGVAQFVTTGVSLFVVCLVGIGSVLVGRAIGRPIVDVTRAMERLAQGDLEAHVKPQRRRDEIGVLISVMEVFRKSAIQLRRREQEAIKRAAEARARNLELEKAHRDAKAANTALHAAKQDIEVAASQDLLTELGNRHSLEEVLAFLDNKSAQFLSIAIDLDRFKEVNDTYGHDAGDQVLKAVGTRLRARMDGQNDYAFRIGGDEFIAILECEDCEAAAQETCSDILFELLQPIRHKGVNLFIGASIGFALSHPDDPVSETLRCADLALYDAKAGGRGRVVAFSDEIGRAHDEKITLIKDFRNAIKNQEIEVFLQPQVDATSWDLVGCEVLARWRHPERGILAPDIFMPIAIETNMIGDIDRHVMDHAIKALDVIDDSGIALQNISVNVSASRLTHPDLIQELRARTDLPGTRLSFEILETVFLDSATESLRQTVEAVKALGITIEVDDFGTGHASLASVIALQPQCLKIDRIFVPGIVDKTDHRDLMRSLVTIANIVGAQALVEGVETADEAKILHQLGVAKLQGYYFSKPLPLDGFIAWALDWTAHRQTSNALRNAAS